MHAKMEKRRLFVALTAFLVFMAALMTAGAQSQRTITDMTGVQATIPDPVLRIAALDPFSTQYLLSLGAADKIVMASAGKNIRGEAMLRLYPQIPVWEKYFTAGSVQIEELVAMKPDIVVAQQGQPQIAKLRELGFPVIVITVENPDAMLKSYSLLASILRTESASKKTDFLKGILAGIEPAKKELSVYCAGSSILKTFGNGALQKWLVTMAGHKFATSGMPGVKIDINRETLLALNPDMILLASYTVDTRDSILADPLLQTITAVKNKAVYRIPLFLYSWDTPGLEFFPAVRWLSSLSPGAVPPFEKSASDRLRNLFSAFYLTLFGYTPKQSELDQLLTP